MTAILAIIVGAIFVGSRAAGFLFDGIAAAASTARVWVLEPVAYWLSGFYYGRRVLNFAVGTTVPEPVIWFLMILMAMIIIVGIGMAALKALERLTQ
jgi:hypothetical protein